MNTKIIAYYLPQFHEIKENNEWWGKGFTEWVNVKNAKSLFRGHRQPIEPLNNNYYNLLDTDVMKWQINMARDNGIYGFCFYHYWFENHMLLEKPIEKYLEHKELDFPFCFSWANHTWRRTWGGKEKTVLLEQTYGTETEWKRHFEYLSPFFKDNRYIYNNDMPVFVIFRPSDIPDGMCDYWNELAVNNGLKGICFISQDNDFNKNKLLLSNTFSYGIDYQPDRAKSEIKNTIPYILKRFINKAADKLELIQRKRTMVTFDYDRLWNIILKEKPYVEEKSIPGAFTDWDDTPRRKNQGSICLNVTADKFEKYLRQLIVKAQTEYKSEFLFMFAWNEWGESGYLEPDTDRGDAMLKAVRNSVKQE